MDQKSWLWRKKSSSEKMVSGPDKVNLPFKANEEEIVMILAEKAELENDLKSLKDKLSSAVSECNAKDDLVKKHAKKAQEATAEWEKAEANVASLKKELNDALQQRAAGEDRITQLDAALKECMQQLRFVREEQEQRIHDAVTKASNEFEKSRKMLEEKLMDSSKRLAKLGSDNTQLSKALLAKEKLMEDIIKQKAQLEADFNAVITRLESTDKDNTSLKYEVRVLEKEVEIHNEEREFHRRTSDASHRQHLESVKKIAKLESECQRLRVLVRKRLPGPAALAKMKSEVEILGRDSTEMRRKRSNYSPTGSLVDDFSPGTPTKKVDFLTEQLCAMEEENKLLKEALSKKANELQFSRAMFARTASKLSQVESHFDELSKSHTTSEPSRSDLISHDLSLASMSDIGSDDKVSCAESWASALVSELEHFKHGRQRGSPSSKTVGASDMSLMDDFVEMEKLAIVSVDDQPRSSHVFSNDTNAIVRSMGSDSNGYSSEVKCKEIIPVLDSTSGVSNLEIQSKDTFSKAPGWLQEVLKVVFEQIQVTQRKPDEILEDIRVALENIYQISPRASTLPHAGEFISSGPTDKSLVMVSLAVDNVSLVETSNQQLQMDLGKSICKIIELIEAISLPHRDDASTESLSKKGFFQHKNTETTPGYMVRLFQWKTSELTAVLQQFVQTCYDMLSGKSDVNRFAQELSSTLEWIMNHCFSLQDVSSMRDAIRKHFDWDESRSESEADLGMIGQFSNVDRLLHSREQLSCLPIVPNGYFSNIEKDESSVRNENKKLKEELINVELAKKDLEEKLHSALDKSESLMNQLQESEKTITSLQTELGTLKGSEAVVENQKLAKEDIDTQLTVTKVELNETRHKLSSLIVELENKNSCCEELEATCLELQLQLESVAANAIPSQEVQQDDKQLRADWEITAASEKLAECQETILNLGKQLKALASPAEASLFDRMITNDTDARSVATITSTERNAPEKKLMQQRSSLLDQMLAEDSAKLKDRKGPNIKENDNAFGPNGVIEPKEKIHILKPQDKDRTTGSLTLVPSKKKGVSLWRKILWSKRKSSGKKPPLSFAP